MSAILLKLAESRFKEPEPVKEEKACEATKKEESRRNSIESIHRRSEIESSGWE